MFMGTFLKIFLRVKTFPKRPCPKTASQTLSLVLHCLPWRPMTKFFIRHSYLVIHGLMENSLWQSRPLEFTADLFALPNLRERMWSSFQTPFPLKREDCPCLRCRPEAAPHSPVWIGKSATVVRALRLIAQNQLLESSEEKFASQMGVSARLNQETL